MKKILTKKGFTLIELIVVIAILAILAAILIPSLTNYLNSSTQAKNLSNARSAYTELMLKVATEPNAATAATLTGKFATECPGTFVTGSAGAWVVGAVTCGTAPNAQTFTP